MWMDSEHSGTFPADALFYHLPLKSVVTTIPEHKSSSFSFTCLSTQKDCFCVGRNHLVIRVLGFMLLCLNNF